MNFISLSMISKMLLVKLFLVCLAIGLSAANEAMQGDSEKGKRRLRSTILAKKFRNRKLRCLLMSSSKPPRI